MKVVATDFSTPGYTVPALDKALDILELLASESGGLTQSEIAAEVNRSVSQIFRVLSTLERRGYIHRDRQSGLYHLSMMMFDLAHRHPPLRGLIQIAMGPMRELAYRSLQSCNLSVLDAERVRVVAQVESPADFGFSVRVGATFPVGATATGAVLVGGAADDVRERLGIDKLTADHLTQPDSLQPGITDIVVPIRDAAGVVVAALTVPYVATTFSEVDAGSVVTAARKTGRSISARLQGLPALAGR